MCGWLPVFKPLGGVLLFQICLFVLWVPKHGRGRHPLRASFPLERRPRRICPRNFGSPKPGRNTMDTRTNAVRSCQRIKHGHYKTVPLDLLPKKRRSVERGGGIPNRQMFRLQFNRQNHNTFLSNQMEVQSGQNQNAQMPRSIQRQMWIW